MVHLRWYHVFPLIWLLGFSNLLQYPKVCSFWRYLKLPLTEVSSYRCDIGRGVFSDSFEITMNQRSPFYTHWELGDFLTGHRCPVLRWQSKRKTCLTSLVLGMVSESVIALVRKLLMGSSGTRCTTSIIMLVL